MTKILEDIYCYIWKVIHRRPLYESKCACEYKSELYDIGKDRMGGPPKSFLYHKHLK